MEELEILIVPDVESQAIPLLDVRRWDSTSRVLVKQWDCQNDTIAATLAIIPLLGNQVKIAPRILPIEKLGNIEIWVVLEK